ncbi:ABC transporter substrate-binding protein [Mariprofundus ferrooxydans]|nr:ABC transporter substrate-binding protein [Mariprofundus ferrooxydans]
MSPLFSYAENEQIALQLKWKHQFQFAGYYMALEKGYYRDAGLDVHLIEGGSGQNAIEFTLTNNNAYAVTDTGALLARAHGKPIKALAAIFQHSPLVLMVLKSSGINTLADLRGKRIMLQTGYQGADLLALLKVGAGLSKDDFTLLDNSFDLQDLIQGKVDAFSVYLTDQPNQLDLQHIAYRIFRPSDLGIDYYGDIMITSEHETEHHSERVDAFMQATVRGWHDALANVDAAVDLILLKYNTQQLSRQQLLFEAKETAKLMLSNVVDIGYMNSYRWQKIANTYADQGFMPADYPVEQFIYKPEPGLLDLIKQHSWAVVLGLLFVVLLIAAMMIVTLRKTVRSAVSKLAESEQNLRNLIELADFGILVHRDGRVLFANTYVLNLLSVASLAEILGQSLMQYVHPDDRADVGARITHVVQHGEVFHRIPVRQISPTGKPHDVEVSAMPIRYEGAQAVMSVFLDVSEKNRAEQNRQKMQRQVEHTQRLESLGVLAGGIAHDFNNLLAVILGHAGMAVGKVERDPTAVSMHLDKVIQSADNAASLCKQMLAYSGKGHFVVEPIDVSQLLRDMIELLEVSIDKNVSIRYRIAERTVMIEADMAQMQQVIMNLVINASEAIGFQGGEIDVCSGEMDANAAYLDGCFHEGSEPGDFVYIEIKDNGCGMDAATIAKIFDPFFTTKFTGRGLGMSAMLGIVRGHHGAIRIESSINQGSAIRVLFPSLGHDAEEVQPESLSSCPDKAHLRGVVLVVDDEASVMEMAVVMLEELGFQTLSAVNGQDAVQQYRQQMQQGNQISFVLLDLTMPVMSGEQAFSELCQINPAVQVIISSGYAEDDVRDRFKGTEIAGFIQKPYLPAALEKVVLQALA